MGNHSPLSTLKPNVAYLQPDELGRNRKIREIITAALNDSAIVKQRLAEESAAEIAEAAQIIIVALRAGKKVFVFGNGGSAADAQHIVAELGGRFLVERPPLPAIALTTNTSMLTGVGNDYGHGLLFSRQLEALASPGDVVIAISTSGRSSNVLEAVRVACAKEAATIVSTALGSALPLSHGQASVMGQRWGAALEFARSDVDTVLEECLNQ